MDKREFIKTSLVMSAGLISMPAFAGKNIISDGQNKPSQGFQQIKLPYSYNALLPYIDTATMELHYSKHHAAYTSNFNKAAENEGISNKSIEDILANISKYSLAARNNGGGFYNHNLFWQCMKPGGSVLKAGNFKKKLEKAFGSFDSFKSQFTQKALTVFGSGWAWLIERDGNLYITSTSNQDNPLMDVVAEKGKPLLTLDVWEHAYYLKYQNRRADYIDAFWNIVDWNFVQSRMS